MQTTQSWRSTNALFSLTALCIVARLVWEQLSPLHFQVIKSAIYVRDAVTLGPACAFAILAVMRMPTRNGAMHETSDWWEQRSFRVACIAAVLTTASCYAIAHLVLHSTPHVVDEAAYLWQAGLLAEGQLTVTVPEDIAAVTNLQYVGDVDGRRISAFFPGSSVPLALGVLIEWPQVVNPILAGVLVLVTFWSGTRLFGKAVGAFGAVLFAASPFLLFQGASFFGHVWTALFIVPALTFALKPTRRYEPVLVGVLLSVAVFSRPVSALAAALSIAVMWLAQDKGIQTARRMVASIAGALPLVTAFGFYNRSITGNWLVTPHRLLLPDEEVLVGLHNLKNMAINVAGMAVDSTGLVLVGSAGVVLAIATGNRSVIAVTFYAATQLALYSLYYNHGVSYGPRYLFEAAPLMVIVIAFGFTQVKVLKPRFPLLAGIAIVISVVGVLPGRAVVFSPRGQYLSLPPIKTADSESGLIVFVTPGPYRFPDPFYGAFVANGPALGDRHVVYVRDQPARRCEIAKLFPGRSQLLLDMDARASKPSSDSATGALETVSPAC